MKILKWDIYEIQSQEIPITGVKFRGRLRKLAIDEGVNLLTENTADFEYGVRFALLTGQKPNFIEKYLGLAVPGAKVTMVKKSVENPVLSKLKINIKERYTL